MRNLPRHPRAEAILRTSLGATYAQLGLGQKAVDQLRKGMALHEKAAGPDDADRLAAAVELARTLTAVGPATDAEAGAIYEDVIARETRSFGAADARVLRARLERAVHWSATGKPKEAVAEAEDVSAILDARGETAGPLRYRATEVLVSSLGTVGRFADAEKVIKAGLERPLEDRDRVTLLVPAHAEPARVAAEPARGSDRGRDARPRARRADRSRRPADRRSAAALARQRPLLQQTGRRSGGAPPQGPREPRPRAEPGAPRPPAREELARAASCRNAAISPRRSR